MPTPMRAMKSCVKLCASEVAAVKPLQISSAPATMERLTLKSAQRATGIAVRV